MKGLLLSLLLPGFVLASCTQVYIDLSYPAWVYVDVDKPTTLKAEAGNRLLDFALVVYSPSGEVFKIDDGFQDPSVYDIEKVKLNPGYWRIAVESQSARGTVNICVDGKISKEETKPVGFLEKIIQWFLSFFGV